MNSRLPGDWRGLVVVIAGSRWDGARFGSQHVAQGLTEYAPVLYVDPPISRWSARKFAGRTTALNEPRLRVVAPRLARLTPVTPPGPTRRGVRRYAGTVVRRAVERAIAALGGDVHAVLAFSTANRLLGISGERVRVFYAKDDFSAGTALLGGDADAARRSEEWAAANADVVIAHSPPLMERWRALGYDPVFVPNGVDAEFFATSSTVEPAPDIRLPAPVVGFVGHLSERIDVAILEAIAARDISVLLVGPQQVTFDLRRIGRLLDRPNVQWVGGRPYEQLPSYMRGLDVGIVPYTTSQFNLASFPLKMLEYLAAGKPVVATDLPAVRWLDSDLVSIAATPEAFADAVEAAIPTAHDADRVAARQALAAEHDWSRRVEVVARAIGLVPDDA